MSPGPGPEGLQMCRKAPGTDGRRMLQKPVRFGEEAACDS